MSQEHHHMFQDRMRRSARSTLRTTVLQQQPQPPANMQQVYHYENSAQPTEVDQHGTEHQNCSNINNLSTPNSTLANINRKTPMCLVNELARYNKIQYQYRLTGEQGPHHKKIFTVTLNLGNEEYEAEGSSIKKAQHSAAAQALSKTEFKQPPPKTITPTVELNTLAMKRGERTVYVVENKVAPLHQGYITQLGYDGQFRPGAPRNPGDPYTVRLIVGEREYAGQGYTVQAARQDAAAKATEHIKQLDVEKGKNSLPPGENDQVHITEEKVTQEAESVTGDVNPYLKSPISLVYEITLKMNLNVTFELLSEKGPPHMQVFNTQCRVGTFITEGEGNSKQISKKRAAEKMLKELSKLPTWANIINIAPLERKRVTNKKKSRKLIRVNVDKPSEEINPISRLIQIQQANKEKEPIYIELDAPDAHRRGQFVIEASVNGHSCTGIGFNKRIAKRNAAEALLSKLGYNNNVANSAKSTMKLEKESESLPNVVITDKSRKVAVVEETTESHSSPSVGGSGGRQLVPGVLLVTEENSGFQKLVKYINKSSSTQPTQMKAQSIQGVCSKDKLLRLAQLMNIHVRFTDFPKANYKLYLSLVSLSTNPPQIFHGEGPTTEVSQEKAALEALKVLRKLSLDNAPTKDSSTASPVPDECNCDNTMCMFYTPRFAPPMCMTPVVSAKGSINQNDVKSKL